jgi:hypothetical protein
MGEDHPEETKRGWQKAFVSKLPLTLLTVFATVIVALLAILNANLHSSLSRDREYLSRGTYQHSYRETYLSLIESYTVIGHKVLGIEDLHRPIWFSPESVDRLRPLEDLAILINSMRQLMVISQLVSTESLDDAEKAEFRYAMAKFLFYAVVHNREHEEWSTLGDDIRHWLERHRRLVEIREEDKALLRSNYFLRGKVAQYHALRAVGRCDTSQYWDRSSEAIKMYERASSLIKEDDPWMYAVTSIVEARSIDYCVEPKESRLKRLGRLYNDIAREKAPESCSTLTEECKDAIAHHINLVEYYLAEGSLDTADVLLEGLKKWAVKIRKEHESNGGEGAGDYASILVGAIYAHDLVCSWLVDQNVFDSVQDTGRARALLEDVQQKYDGYVKQYRLSESEYSDDMTWLHYRRICATLLERQGKTEESEVIKDEIGGKIKQCREGWYFSQLGNYPKLLLRKFESGFSSL